MRLAVFTGSASGTDALYAREAASFAGELAARGIGIVYGGGQVGLMGTVADSAVAAGGEVVGVIPSSLDRTEVGHTGLSTLHVVDSMHERKQMMADLADGFVALPGGVGTLEEIFEAWTWLQLGIHEKPVAFLNINGFWDPLLTAIDSLVSAGFLKRAYRDAVIVAGSARELLDAIDGWTPPVRKWQDPGERTRI
ncbi:MAG: TIGR00730 family Rossman fold protein [Actinomycetota bacterium]